jgi:hypothetical protein
VQIANKLGLQKKKKKKKLFVSPASKQLFPCEMVNYLFTGMRMKVEAVQFEATSRLYRRNDYNQENGFQFCSYTVITIWPGVITTPLKKCN